MATSYGCAWLTFAGMVTARAAAEGTVPTASFEDVPPQNPAPASSPVTPSAPGPAPPPGNSYPPTPPPESPHPALPPPAPAQPYIQPAPYLPPAAPPVTSQAVVSTTAPTAPSGYGLVSAPETPGPDSGVSDAPSPGPRRTRLSLEAVTRLPLDIGAQVRLQTSTWFRLSAGAGFVPEAYVSVVNDTLRDANLYNSITAAAVSSAFESGLTYNFRVGIRPSPNGGIYLDAGYAHTSLDGEFDLSSMLRGQGQRLPGAADAKYQLQTSLDMLMFELGWEGNIGKRMLLGIGLGLMATLDAKTDVSGGEGGLATTALKEIAAEAATTLDSNLTQYGYLPTLTLRLGADLL